MFSATSLQAKDFQIDVENTIHASPLYEVHEIFVSQWMDSVRVTFGVDGLTAGICANG